MATAVDLTAGAPEFATGPATSRRRRLGLWGWTLRRVALGIVTVLVVSILVFLVTHILPADPARSILGQFASPQQLKLVNKQLGLDQPVLSQYLSWLGHAVQGNLGTSTSTKTAVLGIIGVRLENSMTLLAVVVVLALPIAMSLALIAARHRDSAFDHAVVGSSIVASGLPEFVFGILLVTLLATSAFHLLPATDVFPPGQNPILRPSGMILPVATLVIAVVPYLFRLFRGSIIESLETPYVEMARLKGVPERVVLTRHALRNALVPGIMGTGLALIYLLGNVVVIEYLFNFPGMGQELANAVSLRDLPLIQGLAMTFAVMFVLFSIGADLLAVLLTPRLRTEV